MTKKPDYQSQEMNGVKMRKKLYKKTFQTKLLPNSKKVQFDVLNIMPGH